MAKLRKMLGDINSSTVQELMKVIETQSRSTLLNWALHSIQEDCIFWIQDERLEEAIIHVKLFLNGEKSAKEIKPILSETYKVAWELEGEPVKQASARAISTACNISQAPSAALGYTFYLAAARVYSRLGLKEKSEIYEREAKIEFERILESLKKVAVKDDPNPVKVKWYC